MTTIVTPMQRAMKAIGFVLCIMLFGYWACDDSPSPLDALGCAIPFSIALIADRLWGSWRDAFCIFIKDPNNCTRAFLVTGDDSVATLINHVHGAIVPGDVIVVFNGGRIDPAATLRECGIGKDATIHVNCALPGGTGQPDITIRVAEIAGTPVTDAFDFKVPSDFTVECLRTRLADRFNVNSDDVKVKDKHSQQTLSVADNTKLCSSCIGLEAGCYVVTVSVVCELDDSDGDSTSASSPAVKRLEAQLRLAKRQAKRQKLEQRLAREREMENELNRLTQQNSTLQAEVQNMATREQDMHARMAAQTEALTREYIRNAQSRVPRAQGAPADPVRIELDSASQEYKCIAALVKDPSNNGRHMGNNPMHPDSYRYPSPEVEILGIERLDNPAQKEAYLAHLQLLMMEDQGQGFNTSAHPMWILEHETIQGVQLNEGIAWHGCNPEVAMIICKVGPDKRYSGQNAGAMFGKAAMYISKKLSKSGQYRYFWDQGRVYFAQDTFVFLVLAAGGHCYDAQHGGDYDGFTDTNGRMYNSVNAAGRTGPNGDPHCEVEHQEATIEAKSAVLPLYLIKIRHKVTCRCNTCELRFVIDSTDFRNPNYGFNGYTISRFAFQSETVGDVLTKAGLIPSVADQGLIGLEYIGIKYPPTKQLHEVIGEADPTWRKDRELVFRMKAAILGGQFKIAVEQDLSTEFGTPVIDVMCHPLEKETLNGLLSKVSMLLVSLSNGRHNLETVTFEIAGSTISAGTDQTLLDYGIAGYDIPMRISLKSLPTETVCITMGCAKTQEMNAGNNLINICCDPTKINIASLLGMILSIPHVGEFFDKTPLANPQFLKFSSDDVAVSELGDDGATLHQLGWDATKQVVLTHEPPEVPTSFLSKGLTYDVLTLAGIHDLDKFLDADQGSTQLTWLVRCATGWFLLAFTRSCGCMRNTLYKNTSLETCPCAVSCYTLKRQESRLDVMIRSVAKALAEGKLPDAKAMLVPLFLGPQPVHIKKAKANQLNFKWLNDMIRSVIRIATDQRPVEETSFLAQEFGPNVFSQIDKCGPVQEMWLQCSKNCSGLTHSGDRTKNCNGYLCDCCDCNLVDMPNPKDPDNGWCDTDCGRKPKFVQEHYVFQ